MRRELTVKSANLGGTFELTVIAPIKKGFVPSLDAMTYKTRVQRVLRLLHGGRTSLHDYQLARVLSDAVERVGKIHAVRIAVLESEDEERDPEGRVMLAVTFDGTWESYVRIIWQKVTRLLDLIFYNTEGYVIGWESSYEEWGKWLRQHQVDTDFLYSTPGLTGDDYEYLRMQERWQRRMDDRDIDVTRIHIPTAEEIADEMYQTGRDLTNMGLDEELPVDIAGRPAFRQGVGSVVGLYRLADVYPPGTEDGIVLHRAARELLPEFVRMIKSNTYQDALERASERFEEPLEWLLEDIESMPPVRQPPPLPGVPPVDDRTDIQGGVLRAYRGVDHGCLLFAAFKTPSALAKFLKALNPTTDDDVLRPGDISRNVGFTVEGLRLAGLSEDEIESFPKEFVQGMARRAGLLGDVRVNHPRRWRLPAMNWADGISATDPSEYEQVERIDLSAVHVIVHLRHCAFSSSKSRSRRKRSKSSPRELLMTECRRLVDTIPGVVPLSLQWMEHHRDDKGRAIEHFGFHDGLSEPVLKKIEAGEDFPNHVHVGEVLRGYANASDHAPKRADGIPGLLHNGSFLVVRKLRQDIGIFEAILNEAEASATTTNPKTSPLGRDDFLAKMMGRWPAGHKDEGKPLVPLLPGHLNENDFDYDEDKDGRLCPIHAHIRRANPRRFVPEDLEPTMTEGGRPPRLFRRGMSYGPRHIPRPDDPEATAESLAQERGLVFMAYNASIGEQFETVQSWMSGGNSSGSYSGQSDPFTGLAEPGRRRYFRFENQGETVRMALDGQDRLHADPRPLVRLEWGTYLFVPSISALKELTARARKTRREVLWSAKKGERIIGRLREIESRDGETAALMAWKAALEDPEAAADFSAASIWAAIREHHGGVLKTPYGVLAASRKAVAQVLRDKKRNLTVNGYLSRMRRSFGPIYLGRDADQEDRLYEIESAECNAAILSLDAEEAFNVARKTTHDELNRMVTRAIEHAQSDEENTWQVTIGARELIDEVLGTLCEKWFGLSEEDQFFRKDGYRWDWQEPQPSYYPGHFMAPSRYIFQAHPGRKVEEIGASHGRAARAAMDGFLAKFGREIKAPVTRAVLDSELGKTDPDFASRTLIGAIMGFVPTIDANLRRVFHEWMRDSSFWSLRARYAGDPAPDYRTNAKRLWEPLTHAMQLRGAPDLIWRTAVVSHSIGTGKHRVAVRPGEIVVAAVVSAGHEALEKGEDGFFHAFGGDRRAPDAPTHACPGYGPAVPAMVGFLTALVETAHPLRAGPAPLTVSITGRTPEIDEPPSDNRRTVVVEPPEAQTAANLIPIFMYGDSWLKRWNDEKGHLPRALKKLGYGPAYYSRYSGFGQELKEMAEPRKLRNVKRRLRRTPHRAILLGGGGNDLVQPKRKPENTWLYRMLEQAPAPGQDPLIASEVDEFVECELAVHYRKILDVLLEASKAPILIHGYDHPIPDGRPLGSKSWLKSKFELRRIRDKESARDAMKRLIDKLNEMVEKLEEEYETKHPGRVHRVKLTEILEKHFGHPDNYELLWRDELHANNDGYDLLAVEIAKKLKDLGVT